MLTSVRQNIDDADGTILSSASNSADGNGTVNDAISDNENLIPYPPIADPSGAQFAVTREAAQARPRDDYVALREWLLATDLPDEQSGRVFEYLWHVLFGMPGVLCYERAKCECDVYGRC